MHTPCIHAEMNTCIHELLKDDRHDTQPVDDVDGDGVENEVEQ